MNLKKFRIAVLAMLAVTVIYTVALYQSVQSYNAWKQAEIERYCREVGGTKEYWERILDFYPYWLFPSHKPFVYGTIALALLWFVPTLMVKGNLEKLAAFFTGAIIAISILVVPQVLATNPVHVDILCVADEEFDGGTILVPVKAPIGPIIWIPTPSKSVAQDCMVDVSEYYQNEFQIEIHWHYWTFFDSNDDNHYIYSLLYEAMNEKDWYWGKTIDDEPMELMAVFTQQSMDLRGLSLPYERIMVITARLEMESLIMHELGHQFDLSHCTNEYCAMNSWDPKPWYGESCGHYTQLMANRECLLEPPPPPPPPSPRPRGGGGGSGCYYK